MKALRGLKKFSGGGGGGGGGPQSDYSVCPRPLRRVFSFSGFRVFRFLWFSGFQVFRDARFFGRDGTGRGARQLHLIAICNYFAILPKEFSLINVEQSWNLT